MEPFLWFDLLHQGTSASLINNEEKILYKEANDLHDITEIETVWNWSLVACAWGGVECVNFCFWEMVR